MLQQNPQNAEARRLLGQILLSSGEATAAVVELRKALELGAPEAKTTPLLARAVLEQGDVAQVLIQFASTRIDDAQGSADLKTTLASAYAAKGERENALEMVQAALKDWPQYTPAALLQARLLGTGGDVPAALALLDGLVQRDSKNVAALTLKGDIQRFAQHDPAAALASYQAAASAVPGSVTAHAAIIAILMERRDIDGARKQWALLKAQRPDHPETRFYEAQFAFLDKDYAKTRDLVAPVVKAFPNDARALQLAGSAELQLNALGQAESYLSQAVKVAPRLLAPRQLLAQLHLRSGQPQKALDVLQPVLASETPDAGSLTLAGQAYLQAGDMQRSEAAFTRATKVDPQGRRGAHGVGAEPAEQRQYQRGIHGT